MEALKHWLVKNAPKILLEGRKRLAGKITWLQVAMKRCNGQL